MEQIDYKKNEIISWLLEGDVSIQYQTYRDLLDTNRTALRKRIELEGWGFKFLSCQNPNGHWGLRYYQPKWTSTHYTLMDIKNLGIPNRISKISDTLNMVIDKDKCLDGGINPAPSLSVSDVCINGMFLNFASYFGVLENRLESIVDFLLNEKMDDGGFNCQSNRKGASHSSMHSTISVLEGFWEYQRNHYKYRLNEIIKVRNQAHEFILQHKLFRSDRTGEIINPNFLKLSYPCRWYYDILRAMDYFQFSKVKYDVRMEEAIQEIKRKRNKEGLWRLAANYPGQVHFEMEKAGKPSRWNTLRALRILKHFEINDRTTNR